MRGVFAVRNFPSPNLLPDYVGDGVSTEVNPSNIASVALKQRAKSLAEIYFELANSPSDMRQPHGHDDGPT